MAISEAEKTEREPAAERVDLWAIDLAAEMAGWLDKTQDISESGSRLILLVAVTEWHLMWRSKDNS